jgi:hypothetical protein
MENEMEETIICAGFKMVQDDPTGEYGVCVYWKEEGDILFQVNLYKNGESRLSSMRRVMKDEPDYMEGARWTTVGWPHGRPVTFTDEAGLREAMKRMTA